MDLIAGDPGRDEGVGIEPERALQLLDAVGQAVVATDLDGVVTYWNRPAEHLFGWSAGQAHGVAISELIRPATPGAARGFDAHRDAVVAGGREMEDIEVEVRDGRRRRVRVIYSPMRDAAGTVVGAIAVSHDITLRRVRKEAIRESEARFRALIQGSKDVAVIVDLPGTLQYVSPGVTGLLGFSPEELVGTSGWDLVHPEDLDQLREELSVVARSPGAHTTSEYRIRTAHGTYCWVEQTVTNMVDEPVIGGVVANLRDVTDRKLVEADLNHRVRHDQLTGLPNRSHLDEVLATALAEASGAAVLIFDIDQFKLINDSYGHHVGDELLTQISSRLHHALRPGDLAGRFGGDEFVVVCPGVTEVAEAAAIAERLQGSLGSPFELSGAGPVHVSASVGIAAGEAGTDAAELFHDADAAMYEAKRSGRARHAVYDDDMRARANRRLRTENELERALDSGQIEVYYQPLVNLRTGRVVSAEALARWHHPEKGLLPATDFITTAEESGQIIRLGREVLRVVLETVGRWAESGHDLVVAVNLSPVQFGDSTLVASVRDGLAGAGLAPDRLALEITETAVMADPRRSIEVVQELVDLGVHVALDDFGTGYSSLQYLKQLPVTAVKIDQGFVAGIDVRPDDYDIVAAVAYLARSFGRLLIAEGVESAAQLEVLRDLGCELGQGHHWSPAVDAATFEAMLRSQRRRGSRRGS